MTRYTRREPISRIRNTAALDKAIQEYLWTLDNVPGYSWASEYDIRKIPIAEEVLKQLGLPLGPTELNYAHQHERENAARLAHRLANPPSQRVGAWRPLKPALRRLIFERDVICQGCGATERLTIDHRTPRSKGGDDEPTNLQVLCKSCNSRKGARI